jgi:hypothetical protein
MLRRMDPLMNRHIYLILPTLLLLSACGPAATQMPGLPGLVTLTPAAPTVISPHNTREAIQATQPVTQPIIQASATTQPLPQALLAPTEAATATANPTITPYLPTPTETLLPPLELPTERPSAPTLVAWTGQPTYPGDSDPGLLYKVDYDPDVWAQTEGNFGDIVLANRQIQYCTITPWAGRGLPVDWKVDHEFRAIGSASFDVNIVTDQNVVKFVSYVGGDNHVLTGFQVSFNDQQDLCLQDAEAIFGTLRSFSAIPTATPTFTAASATPLP